MKERNKNGPPDRRYETTHDISMYSDDADPIGTGYPQTLIMNNSFGIAPKTGMSSGRQQGGNKSCHLQ
jgi:hypothetical protein